MMAQNSQPYECAVTGQTEPIPGSSQVANSAGGFSWAVNDWTRLDRFLILGAEGGTYYVGEYDLLKANHDAVIRCIKADGIRTLNCIVQISKSGRAPKNDPAIFAFALVVTHGDQTVKDMACRNLYKICRTGTHLFHFVTFVHALRGWGRGLRSAIAHWYINQNADDLAYQAIKYQKRDGWSHGDILRLAHPIARSAQHDAVFRWISTGTKGLGNRTVKRCIKKKSRKISYPAISALPEIIDAFERAKRATTKSEIVSLICRFNLPRETIPTKWLNEIEVWEALLHRMPLSALIRNLGKMTSIGLLKPTSNATSQVLEKLENKITSEMREYTR